LFDLEANVKTLVITGASKGIGLATARKFCDAGYRVINFSRSIPPDARIESHEIDLTRQGVEEELSALLAMTIDAGEICLVHNAARLVNDSAKDTEPEVLLDILRLNLVAPQMLNKSLIGKMQPGSSIIYIGSTLSEKAVANSFSYVTSKHGIVGMMRATCQDLAGSGIHTSCICPGFTNTEMLRAHVGESQDILDSIAALSSFNRLIEPDEIADTIYFASQNPVLNGSVIHANLGQIES
jgi:3-oxoacyl-[acyl-carrier protein] reductase